MPLGSKLQGVIDMLEGWNAIQRDLEQAREVGPWEPHAVQEGQVPDAAPGLGQPLMATQAEGSNDRKQKG